MTHYTPEVLSSAAEFYESQPTGQYDDEAAHALRCHYDLLEALQEVVKLANQAHDHWENDRDAKVGKILLALSGHMPRYDTRIDAIHAAIAKATGVQ